MPQITDLTWQQLETAKGSNNLFFVDPTHGLSLRLATLTGSVVTDKNTTGVVSALYQLRELCALAQITANNNQAPGDRLNSFPAQSASLVSGGYSHVTGVISARVPLNVNAATGVNA